MFAENTGGYIEANRLLHAGAPVIVALSGGADSVALLSVLDELGFDCVAAHCNFHLRGVESQRDMLHAKEIAGHFDIDFHVRDFDVLSRMESTGESVEMACRSLRYSWFSELADAEKAQAVAVGHHKEDRAETFILNLMRGAGITGLTSMNVRNGDVVRPLLWASRAEIEAYLIDRDLPFVSDSSNSSDVHRRNRIRNRLLPLMEELFPGATNSILRSVSNLEAARKIYMQAVKHRTDRYISGNLTDIALLSQEAGADVLLFERLREYGFTMSQIHDMLSGANQSGLVFYGKNNVYAELDRGILSLTRNACPPDSGPYAVDLHRDILYPVHIRVSVHMAEPFRPEKGNPAVAFFDLEYAYDPAASWELRHWRQGDRMIPFGSSSSKLVSDIFSDAKLSASEKRNAWILTRNDEIAWLPGLRNSSAGTVGAHVHSYIRLELITPQVKTPPPHT